MTDARPDAGPDGHGGHSPAFTVFIPTYDRGYILDDALASLEDSSFRDFEVLVLDDGSRDATAELVARRQAVARYPLRYRFQPNRGKHVAHNTAVGLARGELFLTLDSDDVLLPEGLAALWQAWQTIPRSERRDFAGVVAACQKADGDLCGAPLPGAPLDSDFLTVLHRPGIRGEKRVAARTELLREYPYPVFRGERHTRPGIIYNRMSRGYRFRFINDPILRVGHAPDGITANRRQVQLRNPLGYRQYFLELLTEHRAYVPLSALFSYYVRYIKHSLLAGIGIAAQRREVPDPWLWLAALPLATYKYRRDRTERRASGLSRLPSTRPGRG